MISVSSNANMVAADLERASRRTIKRVAVTLAEAGVDVRDEWRANANESSHAYSKHYQKAITSRPAGFLTVDIAPFSGAQSDMSFEFGSRNQPPHLDGQRALDRYAPLIERRIAAQALDF